MKFQKTIDIWDMHANNPEQIKTLQPGQWVEAGGAKGRLCGVKESGTIVVAWQGNAKNHGKLGYHEYMRCLMNHAKGK